MVAMWCIYSQEMICKICPHSTHLYTRPRVDRCALKVNHTPDSAPPVCLNAFASPGPGNRGASISFGPLAIAPPWKVIDDAGLRGATLGGAQMSPKHPNFLINTGSATAADLEALGEMVRKKVYDSSGITLEWEIMRIGEK